MKRSLRVLCTFIAVLMLVTSFSGCGGGSADKAADASAAGQNAAQTSAASDAPKEKVTLRFASPAANADTDFLKSIFKLIKDKTGYDCEVVVVPGNETDSTKKQKISIMAGDEYDFLYINTATMSGFAGPKLILPLDDLIKETGYDVEKIYGTYIKKYNGKYYMIPHSKDVHITFYNKKIFDDAKVPYPSADWTWDDYINIAKKLTDTSKGIYGSTFLEWQPYMAMIANQKKIPGYKPDGTSNFDDPGWAESFKFFADLGNVHKVNIDFLTYKTKKLPFDMFMQGKFGMWPVGNWATTLLTDMKKYPRDFKVGITTLPQVTKGSNVTLGIEGGYAIAATSKHVKEAFKAITVAGEEAYKVTTYVPPRIDLSEEEYSNVAKKIAEELAFDGITEQDVKTAILNAKMDVVPEVVMGPADFIINYTLVTGQCELYATGQKSLEDTMKELKEKADAAIKEDLEASK